LNTPLHIVENPVQALQRALDHCDLKGVAWVDHPARPNEVVVLVFNAGGAFTEAALRACAGAPNPVDAFTRRCVTWHLLPALGRLGAVTRWATPTGDGHDPTSGAPSRVNFSTLARRAGIGEPSRLGILLNPVHGLWWAMRFAAWVTVKAEARATLEGSALWTQRAQGEQPREDLAAACAKCDAPCLRACPAPGASVGTLPINTLALYACLQHLLGGGCEGGCAARSACPVGDAWAYPDEVHRHHHGAFRRIARGDP
jgi:hypothetical protein